MSTVYPLPIITCASGIAGVAGNSAAGPKTLAENPELKNLDNKFISWQTYLEPASNEPTLDNLVHLYTRLAKAVLQSLQQTQPVLILGGDHSCAIGTWSGVYQFMHEAGELGLIWIDAHMDSHTPATSETGRIHGMPVACLLGYGQASLTQILQAQPKIKPENLCLIGVRSFEAGEAALLKELNVKVYFMEEVTERGFAAVFAEAQHILRQKTAYYGISLDVDAIDPQEAPAVGVPEPNGLSAAAVKMALADSVKDEQCIAYEIVEYDPSRDQQMKTHQLMVDLIQTLAKVTG